MANLITGVIIARDEEAHLGPCLHALAWTDARLVLIDSRTRDRSAAVAREHGARVETHAFTTFPVQRNAALDLAETSWVLFVDADERATLSLAREIRDVVGRVEPDAPAGYWIPRRNYIWGGWIQNGGWLPDYQLRLLWVDRARFDENRDVHELAVLQGADGRLREPLIHYNYDRLDQFQLKQRAYASLEARRLHRLGQRPPARAVVTRPVREFLRRYVTLRGYRDGWRGLLLATLLAGYTAATYRELATLTRPPSPAR